MNDLTVLSDAELDAVAGGGWLNISHNKVNVAIVSLDQDNSQALVAFAKQGGSQNVYISRRTDQRSSP